MSTLFKNTVRALFALCTLTALPFSIQSQPADVAHQQEFIESYCIECHNFEDWAGSLDLEGVNLADPLADAEIWEKVMLKFRGSLMPPMSQPRPDPDQQQVFVNYLQDKIDSATLANPNPGPSSLHRLNRTEYGNIIRDLLNLQVDISEYLPADDEGYGFRQYCRCTAHLAFIAGAVSGGITKNFRTGCWRSSSGRPVQGL